jgi:hypothetical protein
LPPNATVEMRGRKGGDETIKLGSFAVAAGGGVATLPGVVAVATNEGVGRSRGIRCRPDGGDFEVGKPEREEKRKLAPFADLGLHLQVESSVSRRRYRRRGRSLARNWPLRFSTIRAEAASPSPISAVDIESCLT